MTFYLSVRVLHVLLAVLWVGAAALSTFILFPALRDTGAGGNPVLSAMMRRRMGPYMGATGGMAALTGLWLYWRFSGGFSLATMATTSGIVFAIGGVAGILATAMGGAMIGRNAHRMDQLIAQGAPQVEIDAALAKAQAASKIVLVLMLVAVVSMTLGHYV